MKSRTDRPRLDDSIEQLTDMQRTAQTLFEREAGRLARKHGIADPRTQRVLRAAGGARQTLDALETAYDAAPTTHKAVDDQIIVFGRVATDGLQAAPNLEVMIEDTGGRVMRAAGSATTDVRGRYRMTIPAGVAERLAGSEYILTVRDSKGNVVHRAPDTLKLELGKAIEVDLVVEQASPIMRRVAVPRRRATQPTDDTSQPADGTTERPIHDPQTDALVVYRLEGEVRGARDRPIPNILVRIFDENQDTAVLLGAALTNREGTFSAEYRWQEIGGDAPPQLMFLVSNANGEELFKTEQKMVFDAKRVARVKLTIPQGGGRTPTKS